MNTRTGVWQVNTSAPERLTEMALDLEERLEEWIEKDPRLIRSALKIVGRQMRTEGGPLDLLGIGLQGEWGSSRSSVAKFAATPSLRRLIMLRASGRWRRRSYSARSTVTSKLTASPWNSCVRNVRKRLTPRSASGEQVLIRELTESDEVPEPKERTSKANEDDLRRSAAAFGFGAEFSAILDAAIRLSLHRYVTHKSVMFAPMADRRRCLFLVYADKLHKGSGLKVYVEPAAFEEFFNVPAQRVRDLLGHTEWDCLTRDRTASFVRGLETLMQEAKTHAASS